MTTENKESIQQDAEVLSKGLKSLIEFTQAMREVERESRKRIEKRLQKLEDELIELGLLAYCKSALRRWRNMTDDGQPSEMGN